MSIEHMPFQSPMDKVEISCRFGERVTIDRGLLKKASDLDLDAPARLIVTHQPFYAVYSVTRMLVGGQRIQLTVDNVIDFWSTAKTLHLRTLADQLETFVAEHLNEIARVRAEMLKVDEEFLERLLEKRKRKGVSRILYRWWRADVKKRRSHFVHLVSKFTPENDDDTLSASTEDTNALKRVEVLRKESASAPALNEMSTSPPKPAGRESSPARSPTEELCSGKSSLRGETPIPSTVHGYPAVTNQQRTTSTGETEDQPFIEVKVIDVDADYETSPEPTAPEAATREPAPAGTKSTELSPAGPPLGESIAAVAIRAESPGAAVDTLVVAKPTAAVPREIPSNAGPPTPAIPPVTQTPHQPPSAKILHVSTLAPCSLPGERVTVAAQRSVVINNVLEEPFRVSPKPMMITSDNNAMVKPVSSRRAPSRSRRRAKAIARTAPRKQAAAPGFRPVKIMGKKFVGSGRHVLIGDEICDFRENSVRSVATIGRDISPHNDTVVCDPLMRTYAEIDAFGAMRTYLNHIEASTKIQEVRAIVTQLDGNRPLLWMSDGTFQSVLEKKLLPCTNEIPDLSPLRNLPCPPHQGWLARMYLGTDCALLYYHCWGLYVKRSDEPSWQLRCEDLFIEYMTPIGRSNRFFIVAKRAFSFLLYRTGDVTQEPESVLAFEPIAILKKWNRLTRCSIVHAACSGVRLMFKISNLQSSFLQFERIDLSNLKLKSLPTVQNSRNKF